MILKDLIWLFVVVLLIGWALGYFGFGDAVASLIQILPVLAIIEVLYK